MNIKFRICFQTLIFFLLLTILGIKLTIHFFPSYWGLIIGVISIVFSFLIRLILKELSIVHFLSSGINAIGCGLASGTYYVYKELTLSNQTILYGSLLCLGFYVVYFLLLKIKIIENHIKLFTYPLLILLLIFIIIGWSSNNKPFFSLLFFEYVIITFFIFALLLVANSKQAIYQNISLCTFGAFVIISIVVLLIISEGDGFDLDFMGDLTLEVESPYRKKPKNQDQL